MHCSSSTAGTSVRLTRSWAGCPDRVVVSGLSPDGEVFLLTSPFIDRVSWPIRDGPTELRRSAQSRYHARDGVFRGCTGSQRSEWRSHGCEPTQWVDPVVSGCGSSSTRKSPSAYDRRG